MSKIYKFYQYPRGVNKGGILNTDISPTITHSNWECNCFFIEIDMAEQQDNGQVIQDYRIRKLTPTECFRLMDVDDTDINKLLNSGISNSQLYKMAGNSIVVNCLYHIFRKLFVEQQNESQQLNLF